MPAVLGAGISWILTLGLAEAVCRAAEGSMATSHGQEVGSLHG